MFHTKHEGTGQKKKVISNWSYYICPAECETFANYREMVISLNFDDVTVLMI